MGSRKSKFTSYLCALFAMVLSSHAFAKVDLKALPWNQMADEFTMNNQEFSGNWGDKQRWRGALCSGRWEYNAIAKGKIDKIEFKMNEDGSINAIGNLGLIVAGFGGSYRSELSFCSMLSGQYRARVDGAELVARIIFIDKKDTDIPDVKLRVLKTRIKGVHLFHGAPHWFDDVLTRALNSTLEKVWSSKVGEWLSDRILAEIKKYLPTP